VSLITESTAWGFLGLAMAVHVAYAGLIRSAEDAGFKAPHSAPKVNWRLPFLLVFAVIVQSVKLRSDSIVTWYQWLDDSTPQPISYLDFFLHVGVFVSVTLTGLLSMCCSRTVRTAGAKRRCESLKPSYSQ
jgi:hypothetical protein